LYVLKSDYTIQVLEMNDKLKLEELKVIQLRKHSFTNKLFKSLSLGNTNYCDLIIDNDSIATHQT
jgi:hypothetical protein